jgi:transcriptional regulator with XRE-family HTH domain
MSPFAIQLRDYRVERGLRQAELAELVGYEQSYVSALELGVKGPPTEEFIGKLINVLNLSEKEQKVLEESIEASQRKFSLPNEAPTEIFWLLHKLRLQIDHLHPVQIDLIETALNLPSNFQVSISAAPSRIRRRYSSTNLMEAKM